MKFISTRGDARKVNSAYAITHGIAPDGGLYVPESFPCVTPQEITQLIEMDYSERAAVILSKFLTDYNYNNLLAACKKAYSVFEEDVVPLVKIEKGFYILELFHGPTHAFKDVALQILPYLLRTGADMSGIKENILILTATSGDTGKAALEGFKNAKGVKIQVFYPSEGVSFMQKLQMAAQEGDNVKVVAVSGNFDDCQSAVKNIFASKEIKQELKAKNIILSSANSINFGRLAPQIAYYFSAYCDLVSGRQIKPNDTVNFIVPTGNFGNILAGYYAKRMGLPVNKLICASNSNNVLSEFFNTGVYNSDRKFCKTTSPSMDILVSSNLERLIFETSDKNPELTKQRMAELAANKTYSITKAERLALAEDFYANWSNEDDGIEAAYDFFEKYNYPFDPHTSVGLSVYNAYKKQAEDKHAAVILATANPYKFPQEVLYAISGDDASDDFKACKKLFNLTAMPVPQSIIKLKEKALRFKEVSEKDNIWQTIKEFID